MKRAAETETFEQNVHHVFLQLLPLFRTDDFTEGVAAFIEKRSPDFGSLSGASDALVKRALTTSVGQQSGPSAPG